MSWRKVKLGDVCTIEKGKIGITKAIPGAFPLVVLGEDRRSHNECHFDGKAVIIPLVSSTGHGHRSLKRIHYEEGKFAVGDILCAVMPKNYNELDSMFLYRYLDVNKEKELVGRMKGMANVSLPIKSLAEIEIPLPSLHDQKTIIDKLSTINNQTAPLTSELTRQLDLVKQLRQSFLREAMQGKLVPQDPKDEPASELLQKIKAALRQAQGDKKGKKQKELPPVKEDEIPFEIPENWAWCRFDDLISSPKDDVRTGPFGSSLKKGEHKQSGVPVWGIESISKDGKFTAVNKIFVTDEKSKELKSFIVKARDLIVSRSGTIGELCMLPVGVPAGIISTNLMKISVNNTVILPEYFCHIIKGGPFIRQMLAEFCSGTTRLFITQKILNKLIFPLPPLAEQHRIVAKLEQLMQLCDDLEQSIRQSKEQTDMLLQTALKEALQPNSFSLTPEEIAVVEGKG